MSRRHERTRVSREVSTCATKPLFREREGSAPVHLFGLRIEHYDQARRGFGTMSRTDVGAWLIQVQGEMATAGEWVRRLAGSTRLAVAQLKADWCLRSGTLGAGDEQGRPDTDPGA